MTITSRDTRWRWALPLLAVAAAAALIAMDSGDRLFGAAKALFSRSASNVGDPWPNVVAATKLAGAGWPPIYRGFQDVGASFIYPPFAAMVFRPLAGLDKEGAHAALSAISKVLFVICLGVAFGLAKPSDSRKRWVAPLFVAVAGTTFYPLLRAVELNQATLIVSVATGMALWLMSRGNPIWAGIVFAIAVGFKPHLLFVVPLMFWSSRKFAAGAVAALGAMLVLSLAYAGWSNHLEYVTLVAPRLSAGYAFYPNQSWLAALLRLQGAPFVDFELAAPTQAARVASILIFLTSVVFASCILRSSSKLRPDAPVLSIADGARRPTLALAFAWLAVTLGSPVSWEHHYAPALFAYAILAREHADGRLSPRSAICVAASFPLVACYIEVRTWTSALGRLATSYVLMGGLLLCASLVFGLVALRQKSRPASSQVHLEPDTPGYP